MRTIAKITAGYILGATFLGIACIADTNPPTPNPPTWENEPVALSTTSIDMRAGAVYDSDGGIQYSFYGYVTGSAEYFWSGWIDDQNYTATDLQPETVYEIIFRTRDSQDNRGSWTDPIAVFTEDPIDTTPPMPNPAAWQTEPTAISSTEIEMEAVTATDSSTILYGFLWKKNAPSEPSFWSGWKEEDQSHIATDLEPDTEYIIWVVTKDEHDNQGGWSPSATVTTLTEVDDDVTPPTPNPSQWASDPIPASATSINMEAVVAEDDLNEVEYLFQWKTGTNPSENSGWIDSASYTAIDLLPDTTYYLWVITRDTVGNTGVFSAAKTVKTPEIDTPADPGTPRMYTTAFDTKDYVITTHDIRDYGVEPDSGVDVSDEFQDAIDDCSDFGGGVIFVPAGTYRFNKRLTLKPGVSLRGEWRNPETDNDLPYGTLFMVYYGANLTDAAPPFITMQHSTGLKDLAIWYPNQDIDNPTPYAWTIQQSSDFCVNLENLTIYNAWKGIRNGPEGNQLMNIKNLFMTALQTGMLKQKYHGVQRMQKIYLRPNYWVESGLANAPTSAALKDFLLQNGKTGLIIAHIDWNWMYDWVIEGFNVGMRLTSATPAESGPNGGVINMQLINNKTAMQYVEINGNGWADTEVLIRSDVEGAIGIDILNSLHSVVQFLNITFEGTFDYCVRSLTKYGCVSLSGCTFADAENYAVYASGGTLELIQNTFTGSSDHIYLDDEIRSTAILGNTFAGSPDIVDNTANFADIEIDHTYLDLDMCDISEFEFPDDAYKPGQALIFNVKEYGAKGNGTANDSPAFNAALAAADASGGGTVYVPVGTYKLLAPIVIPENTQLRGVFDNPHHTINKFAAGIGIKGSELYAYPGKGNENGTAFINMQSGSSLRGITVYYPEQKWSDYLSNGEFTPFPWTIQSWGQNVHVKDVTLANSYKGADFGTYNSTGHNISYLCGAPLDTGLYIDNCYGKGYVKNCLFNPSFWAWSGYPDTESDVFEITYAVRETLTAFVVGDTQDEHMIHNFSFGSRIGILQTGNSGGFNGINIQHGVDFAGISLLFEEVGDNAQFLNCQLVSMEENDEKSYLQFKDTVDGRAEFYNLKAWGHDPCTEVGIDMQAGDVYMLLSNLRSFGTDYGIRQTGGNLKAVGMRFGEMINTEYYGGSYTTGLYGFFGAGLESTELIAPMKRSNVADNTCFTIQPSVSSKVNISHSVYHLSY